MKKTPTIILLVTLSSLILCVNINAAPATKGKTASAFYNERVMDNIKKNIADDKDAGQIRDDIVEGAEFWRKLSDDQLWDLMFGWTITRSWMVWSNGYCPSCKKSVPMYTWKIDAKEHPWKVRCPYCEEFFPKNDFHAFYKTGLDDQGVFDYDRADRSLLYNVEHLDSQDELHHYGVDDGNGYVDDEDNRWRFIGTYLIYGQWKQLIVGGVKKLSDAYIVTQDPVYAHKAAILLDRVADFYPHFDFGKQAVLYEKPALTGYVSTWHDAAVETKELALAYDKIFPALEHDQELVVFLSEKACKYNLKNTKQTIAQIKSNIEERILNDAIMNSGKIRSNYPRREITLNTIRIVQNWPHNKDDILAEMERILSRATAVDGLTGEKGLTAYSASTVACLAQFLGDLDRLDAGIIPGFLERVPNLKKTYLFHIQTSSQRKYYPNIGDCEYLSSEYLKYPSLITPEKDLSPSSLYFLWRLYNCTGDIRYLQLAYNINGGTVEGIPWDIAAENQPLIVSKVADVVEKNGPGYKVDSVDMEAWHLACLRSGKGENERLLWIDYDNGGAHAHNDGFNIGLIGNGLKLIADFGYPPVQYDGGWGADKFFWYLSAAAHNTVVIDDNYFINNSPQSRIIRSANMTLWADGSLFNALSVRGAVLRDDYESERTLALVDISDTEYYVIDVFRVIGGNKHGKYMHASLGSLDIEGKPVKSLPPLKDSRQQLRKLELIDSGSAGKIFTWKVKDYYNYTEDSNPVHVRCFDLTPDSQLISAEGWVNAGHYNEADQQWIPLTIIRHENEKSPCKTCFVSVYVPYGKNCPVESVRRLDIFAGNSTRSNDGNVALEIELANGKKDIFVDIDEANVVKLNESQNITEEYKQPDNQLSILGRMCWFRQNEAGKIEDLALSECSYIKVEDREIRVNGKTNFLELSY